MVTIQHHPPRGRWSYLRRGQWRSGLANGKHTTLICCPCCGYVGALRETHEIAADGTVSPAYWHDVTSCGYYEFIRLEDWAP